MTRFCNSATAALIAGTLDCLAPSGAALAAPSLCNDVAGNLVANCGFEEAPGANNAVIGWDVTGSHLDGAGKSFASQGGFTHSGQKVLVMADQASGTFVGLAFQLIPTVIGHAYKVGYSRLILGDQTFTIDAVFGGTDFDLVKDGEPGTPGAYAEVGATIVARSTTSELAVTLFSDGGNRTGPLPDLFLLDDFSVVDLTVATAVPEPGTFAIFGLGLAGLGLMRRRRTPMPQVTLMHRTTNFRLS